MLESNLNTSRLVGCEYECYLAVTAGTQIDTMQTIVNVLSANGIPAACRGYSHAPIPPGIDMMIETDSSIRPESRFATISHVSIEAKTRPMTIVEFERIAPKTLDILKYLGCRVNASTGHHVHVGVPEVRQNCHHIRSLWNLMGRYSPVLFSLVSESRKANSFCKPMPEVTKLLHGCRHIECYKRILSQYDRYMAVNFTRIFEDGNERLEFRQHGGTLSAEKSRMWIRLLVRMVDHAIARSCQASPIQISGTKAGLNKMLVTCGLKVNSRVYSTVSKENRECGRWLLKRFNQLNRTGTDDSTPHSYSESE